MDTFNEKLLGLSMPERLKYHWGIPASGAAECLECGYCETLCTQHLPIMERLKEIAALQ